MQHSEEEEEIRFRNRMEIKNSLYFYTLKMLLIAVFIILSTCNCLYIIYII